jgi:putative membrane protein
MLRQHQSTERQESVMRNFIAIIIVALGLPALALAADVSSQTKDFVSDVAVGNKFEIDTSQLALKYAKSPDVKNFAQQMITDHTKAGEEFKTALMQAKIEPPAENDVTHTAKYAKLRLFTTKDGFDAAYMDDQLKAHQETVAKFKDYAANGPTPEIKAFANNLLPTLEHHLSMAKDLEDKVGSKT